jgi:cobalt/nickel transport system permease protein
MHIPDGYLSAPVLIGCGAVSICALFIAGRKMGGSVDQAQVPAMGIIAAFIFAAQMINFPIAGGTSGHVLGGVLSAVLVGPEAGVLIMSVVLIVQALLFGDGGLLSLGANILNMALIGAWGGFLIFRALKKLLRNDVVALGIASWLSVVLPASACAIELSLSGTVALSVALPLMAGIHAIIGIGEAIVTVVAISFVRRVRPEIALRG